MGVRRNRAVGDAPDRRNTASRLLLFIQEATGSSKPQAETEQEKEVAEGDPASRKATDVSHSWWTHTLPPLRSISQSPGQTLVMRSVCSTLSEPRQVT